MQDHRTLGAFQKADKLVLAVYQATKQFPKDELFGLTSQLRRAAVSVSGNIVEGCGRNGQKELRNFLNIAFGSLREAGYYIDLALKLDYIPASSHKNLQGLHNEASKALLGLMRSVQTSTTPKPHNRTKGATHTHNRTEGATQPHNREQSEPHNRTAGAPQPRRSRQ